MRLLISLVVMTSVAFAQGAGSSTAAGSGAATAAGAPTGSGSAPTGSAPTGSAPTGSAPTGSAPTGSAPTGSAPAGSAPAGSAPTGSAPAAVDVSARQRVCEQALAAPPGGDTRFVGDVQNVALGQTAQAQLAKTAEGQACLDAITGSNDFRAATSTYADTLHAKQRDAEDLAAHEQAAAAIAKNQKHVVLAYAALWVLAAVFLLFLWRRQQNLKAEIANLKRDLDAATK